MQSTVTDMSVQGTILVLDGTSTNRIMLKVQLTAAWYHVVQGEKLEGLAGLLRRTRPDLVLTAQTLPDGTATDVKQLLAADPDLADVPVVAIAAQNDKAARLKALSEGLDDVLVHPFKDSLLLAQVRSLLRARAETQDLKLTTNVQPLGFAEPAVSLIAPPKPSRVAVLARTARSGAAWRNLLADQTRHNVSAHTSSNLQGVLSGPVPDAIVIEVGTTLAGLNVLADLKSRAATRRTVLIAVLDRNNATLAAEALDRGADAVCMGGFCVEEVRQRLTNRLARKTQMDQMRASLHRGIAESWIDPLTGLHNRRYAMRAMDQIARKSLQLGQGFAVMLADLDHFKSINDQYGHAGGDIVLTEAGTRMERAIGSDGFVARIGGEEFMIGLPHATETRAVNVARSLCNCIRQKPFSLPDNTEPVPVTISIGLITTQPTPFQTEPLDDLIKSADTALYAAKKAGRNQVRVRQCAA
ncbi:diguanylate cyclase [Ruegeria lacuscaerulensis]|uniref:diguanylate cyclase n=2 Tax=Ruegeria lacuscaerulensis TaxID=55218 RepID=UPI001F15E70B|nr:diguanylate cyclase [Ruegeria lacuscaerulensis]